MAFQKLYQKNRPYLFTFLFNTTAKVRRKNKKMRLCQDKLSATHAKKHIVTDIATPCRARQRVADRVFLPL